MTIVLVMSHELDAAVRRVLTPDGSMVGRAIQASAQVDCIEPLLLGLAIKLRGQWFFSVVILKVITSHYPSYQHELMNLVVARYNDRGVVPMYSIVYLRMFIVSLPLSWATLLFSIPKAHFTICH